MPLPIMNDNSNTQYEQKYYFYLRLLLAIAAVVLFVGIGFRSPWPADEPRFAEVAREMVQSGQWLIPQRGVEFYPDKPPLFMWSIAAFYWLTGNLKIAFLLPSALAGLLTLLLTFDIGRRLWNVKTAVIGTFLLLMTPQFLLQAKFAQIDAMVAFLITVGCYGLIRHYLLGPNWGWYCLSWFAMGLGVITKGVGFLPILMFIPIIAYTYLNKNKLSSPIAPQSGSIKMTWLGPVLCLIAIALWVVPMLLFVKTHATPELIAYKHDILFKQTAERYAKSWTHLQSWHYFFTDVIPILWFPLPILIIAHWRAFIAKIKTDPKTTILFIWVLLVLLFFSLSPGKRGVYILPALPMFCLVLASVMTDRANPKWFEISFSWLLRILTGVLLIISLLSLFNVHAFMKLKPVTKIINDYPGLLHSFSLLLLTLTFLCGCLLLFLHKRPSLFQFLVCTLTVWLFASTWGYSLLEPERTPRHLMLEIQQKIGDHSELGLVSFKEQFILFSPMNLTHFGYLKTVEAQQKQAWLWMTATNETHRFLLVPDNALQHMNCFDSTQAQLAGKEHRSSWMLLSQSAAKEKCAPPKNGHSYYVTDPGSWIK